MRTALLSISTSRAAGLGPDLGGDALERFTVDLGGTVIGRDLISDDPDQIRDRLCHWADHARADLILTTGGTGLAPSDHTPEATRAVIEREAPGLAEAMRLASREHTAHWMLSRGVAGIRGRSLIVNFPGSPRSISEAGAAIAPSLPHAVALISGASGSELSHVPGARMSASHPSRSTAEPPGRG